LAVAPKAKRIEMSGQERPVSFLCYTLRSYMVPTIAFRYDFHLETQAPEFLGQDPAAGIDSFFTVAAGIDVDKGLQQPKHLILFHIEVVADFFHFAPSPGRATFPAGMYRGYQHRR
jgi:hypothetical protein